MKKIFNAINRHIIIYIATFVATLIGYIRINCDKNCPQCFACLPLSGFILGFVFFKKYNEKIHKFFLNK